LFSAPMVKAILDGSKTQTRRILKKQPYISAANPPRFRDILPGDLFIAPDYLPTDDKPESVIVECKSVGIYDCMGQIAFAKKYSPYGQVGDRLWVREAFIHEPADYCWEASVSIPVRPEHTVYRADSDPQGEAKGIGWKPSIHMPRSLSRINLEIVSIRVERLNDISREDAAAEGACYLAEIGFDGRFTEGLHKGCKVIQQDHYPEVNFANLWESINGAGSWAANPWVWVITFRKVD